MSIDKTYEGENEIFDHTRHYFRIPLLFYHNIYGKNHNFYEQSNVKTHIYPSKTSLPT